ncbi:prephenate dehydrogenase [Silvibacterium dinghuense]|uniref:Prephenate dehydrogenase/arogenate dehydrogenase family protein n=1 Tax=Silvibacterium dinghuense TaxID=1560006 RepID=A0A4Q1SJF3_9BACT|nr:prephenate dehydrogenase/arogenate dehydrogenase family protein [Silvibacterium dinghuense]RXS97559.1 prephenate dehydrogenase/arogenate dehydrogenase family protein [Silvibacterium dinghuense]GGH00027.1 hypothetical protein GCM10011586_14500 [Silvibacterium dinghuense]
MPIERIAILGTGLIGASAGLALRSHGFAGTITGWDPSALETRIALETGAIHCAADPAIEAALDVARSSDVILLSGPVFTILEWLDRLAPELTPAQLVTDVGSVKGAICARATGKYNMLEMAGFLPGHPMAGKEVGGAANADGALFENAAWLFTETKDTQGMSPAARTLANDWRAWTARFGSRVLDLAPERHDEVCAWVSHLPQYLATALSALLEDEFPSKEEIQAIGGRALREMTRLGSSPFSMWRDIAHTNTEAVAASILALEQRLQHLRENLKTPELREEFVKANLFRNGL